MIKAVPFTVKSERTAFHTQGVRHKRTVDCQLARVLLDKGDSVFPDDASAHDGIRTGVIIRSRQSRFQTFVVEDDNGVASVRTGVFHFQSASRSAQQVVDDRAFPVGIAGSASQLNSKRLVLGNHHAGVHPQRAVVGDGIRIGSRGIIHNIKPADLPAEHQASAIGARHADAVIGKNLAELDIAKVFAFQRSGRQGEPAFRTGFLMGDERVHNGVNVQIDCGGIVDDKPAVSLVNDGRPGHILVDVIRPQGKIQCFRGSRPHRNISGNVDKPASGSQRNALEHAAVGPPQTDRSG